jgi:hypothetical protein
VGGVLGIASFGSIHLAVLSSSAGLAERSLGGPGRSGSACCRERGHLACQMIGLGGLTVRYVGQQHPGRAPQKTQQDEVRHFIEGVERCRDHACRENQSRRPAAQP